MNHIRPEGTIMRPLSFGLAILFAAGILAADGERSLTAADIIDQLLAERKRNPKSAIDVTHIVAPIIPVGSEESTARGVLAKNGFAITVQRQQDGSSTLIASRLVSVPSSIFSDEYRVVITISNGRVISVAAMIFFQSI